MNITDFIKYLKEIRDEHGNIPVIIEKGPPTYGDMEVADFSPYFTVVEDVETVRGKTFPKALEI